MKSKYGVYKLVGREIVPINTQEELDEWKRTEFPWPSIDRTQIGNVTVSTIFLNIDHGFDDILFETLVLGGDKDGYMERCSTYDEAEEQHRKICEMVKAS